MQNEYEKAFALATGYDNEAENDRFGERLRRRQRVARKRRIKQEEA